MPAALNQMGGLPLLVLMFVAMYFLLVAPNQKKQKAWQADARPPSRAATSVTTTGGMRGTIVSVKDDVDHRASTQPDGVKFEIVKSAVAAVTTEDDSVTTTK